MKIYVLLRTRNEEENVERFCRAYSWADKILLADGGSSDRTVELASKFPNVSIRHYPVFMEMRNGHVRTPHGSHLNFLIDWAFIEEGADWVIQDDCDCFPNYKVKEDVRQIMETTNKDYIYITRFYLWKNEGHFPALATPTGDYTPGLWAWRRKYPRLRFRADKVSKDFSHQELVFIPPENEILRLFPPYALLHCPWQTDEMVGRKLKFYRESGQIEDMKHPLEFGGGLEQLPEFLRE